MSRWWQIRLHRGATLSSGCYMLLTHTDVQAGEQVLARLEAQATRRHFWGAVGGGVGYGVGLTASLLLDRKLDGAGVCVTLAGWFFGSAVGQSLSAVFPVNPSSGRVRVTAMQPHGMADYLHSREIAVELGLALSAGAVSWSASRALAISWACRWPTKLRWPCVRCGAFAGDQTWLP